jgi:hypothetical protein
MALLTDDEDERLTRIETITARLQEETATLARLNAERLARQEARGSGDGLPAETHLARLSVLLDQLELLRQEAAALRDRLR